MSSFQDDSKECVEISFFDRLILNIIIFIRCASALNNINIIIYPTILLISTDIIYAFITRVNNTSMHIEYLLILLI